MRRNAIGTRENVRVLEDFECGGLRVEILEYEKLMGLTNTYMAQQVYFMEKQHIRARQIALYLNNDKVTIEKGAMSYFQGDIQMVSGVTVGNALGRLVRGAVTGEQMAQPEYTGTGLLVLEPSFKHFLVLELANNESIIIDDGMFYCAQGTVRMKAVSQRSFSSAVAGGEGIFQQQLTGPGLIVLESPVPMSEIDIIELNGDTLKVDGNFAVLRSSELQFTVERSAKTLIGSAVSGEGLVNVYRGKGQVWLAPTIKIYKTMGSAFAMGMGSTNSMNMNTSRS
ncbi:MAG: AIM24 family protein [Clostridia bacterium]|nr:AIM24 family protein [Clostridia bacterium]